MCEALKKKNRHGSYIDASKALTCNKMHHLTLFQKLIDHETPNVIIKILQFGHNLQKVCTKVGAVNRIILVFVMVSGKGVFCLLNCFSWTITYWSVSLLNYPSTDNYCLLDAKIR